MVTVDKKSTIDIHTKKKKQSKHNSKDSHQIPREENERGREEKRLTNQILTINKMAITTYISIITSNVNRLNAPKK